MSLSSPLHFLHFYRLLGGKAVAAKMIFLARMRLENSRGYFCVTALASVLLKEHFFFIITIYL